MLDCDLLEPDEVNKTLKTLSIKHVDFSGVDSDPSQWDPDDYHVYEYDSTAKKRDYSALKSLTVSGCKFDMASDEVEDYPWNFSFDPDNGLVTTRSGNRRKRCPLHNMFKGARGLQSLKVIFETGLDARYEYEPQLKSTVSSRVVLDNMRDLTIPPPSVMFLDILAPKVERLSFVLSTFGNDNRGSDDQFRLIPLIEDSPITIETLSNLTHLEFETGVTDTTSRLEVWLSQVPNLTSLSIRGNANQYRRLRSEEQPGANSPVSECILELLLEHPEWMPKLTELSLMHCRLPDDLLRKFVERRRHSDNATALTRLSLSRTENMSTEMHTWLHETVQKSDGSGTGFSDRVLENFHPNKEYCQPCESALIGSAKTVMYGRMV
jgi:hypothetical protein